MEQPEDLGALASGPHEGLRPASMWQWRQLADLLQKGLRTVAFHQAIVLALPTLGRPASCCRHRYPCQTVSTKACRAMTQKAATLVRYPLLGVMGLCSRDRLKVLSKLQVRSSGPLNSASGFPLCSSPPACMLLTLPLVRGIMLRQRWDGTPPFLPTARGGGGGKPFHDGGGLCSPGRWPHHDADGPQWEMAKEEDARTHPREVGSLEQLEKEAFRMAAGGSR